MPRFSGRVNSIVFENANQSFYILKMYLDTKSLVTVRGSVVGISVDVGTWFAFDAEWVEHDQFGKQLAIQRAPIMDGWSTESAINILKNHSINSVVIDALESFEDELVPTLDKLDPDALTIHPNIDHAQADRVIRTWKSTKAYFQTLEFLYQAGVPKAKVNLVWSTFRDGAEDILSTNPWALTRIDGITFQQADEVARRLQMDMQSPARIEGAALYVIKTRRGLGHMYLASGEILQEVNQILNPPVDKNTLAMTLVAMHKSKLLHIDAKTKPGTMAIYEPWFYLVESESAAMLRERVFQAQLQTESDRYKLYLDSLALTGERAREAHAKSLPLTDVARAALEDWSTTSGMIFSGAQQQGALQALTEPVSIVTGLPGSGKTSLVKAVVSLLRDAGVSLLLLAPTGIAAKRLASVTGHPAYTIHRAFGAKGLGDKDDTTTTYTGVGDKDSSTVAETNGEEEVWKCQHQPHTADVVFVDEMSMVDTHLLYRVLSCTKPSARIVMIGDAEQLPSVGPGNVLRDLIQSGVFPVASLKEIFRQANTSQIVVAAHDIQAGRVPTTSSKLTDDFVLIPTDSEEDALGLIVKLAEQMYAKRVSFQIMSPRHAGTVGVTNLNAVLRERLNPKLPGLQEMKSGNDIIREDDRIMVVKNNYGLNIYNGDVGKVSRIDKKEKHVEIKLHGPPATYVSMTFKDAGECLRLAYGVTVHKMQGQEADCVIFPVLNTFGHQLQRNLFYTAITRAKQRVFLVGQVSAIKRAVENAKTDARNTLLLDRLKMG